MRLLRQDYCEEALGWDMELQSLQKDRRWRSLHGVVSLEIIQKTASLDAGSMQDIEC